MFDILALGELLIDFTPKKIDDEISYVPNPGGAPCNYLTMASHMGAKTAFIGKVGNDNFGLMLKSVIENEGINTDGLVVSSEEPTTLAFVHLDNRGDRSFTFFRNKSADVMLREADVNLDMVDQSKAIHFGSLSFTDEPSKSTVLKVLDYSRQKGKKISYDPNYRPLLWKNESQAIENMKIGFEYANFVKISDDEAELITGEMDYKKGARSIIDKGPDLVLVTLGQNGVYYCSDNYDGLVPGYKADVVDTTGAGDIFFGAFMGQVSTFDGELTEDKVVAFLEIANAAAALSTERFGGIPSAPQLDEVLKRIHKNEF